MVLNLAVMMEPVMDGAKVLVTGIIVAMVLGLVMGLDLALTLALVMVVVVFQIDLIYFHPVWEL